MSGIVHFGEEPYGVRLMPKDVPIEQAREVGEVCPLLAVDGNHGLVVRNRELFWWPLDRIRVVLQPEPESDDPASDGEPTPIVRERDI